MENCSWCLSSSDFPPIGAVVAGQEGMPLDALDEKMRLITIVDAAMDDSTGAAGGVVINS